MRKMSKGILFAVLMGIVLPVVLMQVAQEMKGNEHKVTEQTIQTEDTEQLQQTSTMDESFSIPILLEDGSLIQMDLETYITGVVLAEMPASFENEALKAQAVVARTYALKHFLFNNKHTDGTICTDSSCCQAYCDAEDFLASGGTKVSLEKVTNAVLQTDNEVLTFHSELIDATYFSCSGGKTEDAQAVWGSEVPYLRSVDSPGEEKAAYHIDTVYFTLQEFADSLQINCELLKGDWIGEITYTNGGGVKSILICNQQYSGTQIRQMLGLRSTAFSMTAVGNTVTVTTKGFGHRVGMSQYGADAMAVTGKNYREILAYYYQGSVLEEFAI